MAKKEGKKKSGSNMKISFKDNELVIRIQYDPNKTYPDSSTGKSQIVAGTKGFYQVDEEEGLGLSLNFTRKK